MACLFRLHSVPSCEVRLPYFNFYIRFPSFLHPPAWADIWHSKAILLFVLLNNWNSSFFFLLSNHTRSPFSSRSSRQIWLSKLWKCQHCGLSVCMPGGRRGLLVHARSYIILSNSKCIRYAMQPYHRGTSRVALTLNKIDDGWANLHWEADNWRNGRQALCIFRYGSVCRTSDASLLFVFPAVQPPSPPLPFPLSHHLNYMCLAFAIPSVCLSPLRCHWLPLRCTTETWGFLPSPGKNVIWL